MTTKSPQDYDLKDLAKLYADVEVFGIRENEGCNLDSVLLTGREFKQPDGTIKQELALSVVDSDYLNAAVPLVDILKFAFKNCPDLVYQALRETGTTGDIRDITKQVDADYDMESGS